MAVLLGGALLGRDVLIGTDQMTAREPWNAEFPDGRTLTKSPLGDTFDIWDPQRQLFADAAAERDFALWNPYPSGGAPLGGEPSTGTLGPFQITYLVLPDWFAPAAVKLLELAAAAGFTYLFLRRVGLVRAAAAIGGLVYTFNGFQLVWTNWPQTRVGALLPALFWACERLLQKRRPLDAALLAVVVASLHFEGFPAVTLAGLGAAGVYVLVRCLSDPETRSDVRRLGRPLGLAAAGVAVGTGLAACQLLPFAKRLPELGLTRDQSVRSHLDPAVAVTLAVPRWFGAPDADPFRAPGNYVESLAYVGAAACLLAIVGLVRRRPAGVTPGLRTFAGVGMGLCLVLVFLGGPLLGWFQSVPPFDSNFVGRLRAVLSFFVAILAAIAVHGALAPRLPAEELPRRLARLAGIVVIGLVCVLGVAHVVSLAQDRHYFDDSVGQLYAAGGIAAAAGLGLLLARRRVAPARWAGVILVALLVLGQAVDLWSPLLPRSEREEWFPETAMHRFLQGELGHDRVATAGSTLIAGSTARYGIRTATGHVFTQPTWKDLLRAVDRRAFSRSPTYSFLQSTAQVATSPILDRMGARFFATGEQAAILGFPGAAPPTDASRVPMRLDPGESASVASYVERLRGVAFELRSPLESDDPLAKVVAVVEDDDGTVIARGSRRVHKGMGATVHTIPVAAEEATWDGQAVTVRLAYEATDGELALARGDVGPWLSPIAGGDDLSLVFSDGGQVYERRSALPRVRWASDTEVIGTAQGRIAALRQGVDPDTVILDESARPARDRPAGVRVVRDGLDTMTVDVDAEGAGYLVVADALQLGWTARVDGSATDLVHADHAFGAVYVPEGEHRVTLSYDPPGLGAGRWLSLASAVAVLAVGVASVLQRRRSRRLTEPPDGKHT
ncbi:MAG TPA: YfhO family protein [Acidimicrobiales bacterium]|nr:YfhO family protein [Acidimicrobiales bacterium]